ncbi:MAG TPA: RNA-binding protein [Armatimonadota bacterium]|jgi:RNA recognition motif-containing protein
MSKRLFVGNLAYNTQENELQEAFAPFGVSDVHMPTDRMSGRPRGFAFVTVDDAHAAEAIAAFDGKQLGGRTLTVNEAQPRETRPSFGAGGGGGGYGDDGGRRGGGGSSRGGERRGGGGGYDRNRW